jgi:hypothetical protein
MRTFIGYKRTYCDCPECALNCQYIPGYLLPTDLPRISAFHGVTFNPLLDWQLQDTPFPQFILANVLASPGALVLKGGRPCRIPTLVPARSDNGWCKFFDGRLCTIHSVAPFGCAFFDAHQDSRVSSAISGFGLTIIARLWEEEPRSLYCQVWNDLYRRGLIAPSPEQCRHLMENHKGENKQGLRRDSERRQLHDHLPLPGTRP